ncbi:MAG: umuDC operon-like protein, partial [Hymenobacter sp.]
MTNIYLIRITDLTATPFVLPVFSSLVPAGFPSPASDELAGVIDLNRLLLRHPDAT